jgi:hypothetical protein
MVLLVMEESSVHISVTQIFGNTTNKFNTDVFYTKIQSAKLHKTSYDKLVEEKNILDCLIPYS